MNRRFVFLTALAAAHLLMVACSSVGLLPGVDKPVPLALRWYGSMSGASNGYGFFKEVGSGCKVTCILSDKDGRIWKDELDRSGNREAQMRANGSIYMIVDFRDELAASWAANMLARHPTAYQVVVQFEQYEPPSMADFRVESQPEWKTTYVKVFRRAGHAGSMPCTE